MPKYKVLIKNQVEIGKFKSENGILNVTNPTKQEQKKIENGVRTNMIKEMSSPTKTTSKITDTK